jgi:FMN-dependent NADH-azoreductase
LWCSGVFLNGGKQGANAPAAGSVRIELLGNRKVVVITARGGSYEKGSPREKFDFQEPYLRHIFGFVGLTDVTFIHAENQLRDGAGPSLAAATEQVGHLVA